MPTPTCAIGLDLASPEPCLRVDSITNMLGVILGIYWDYIGIMASMMETTGIIGVM